MDRVPAAVGIAVGLDPPRQLPTSESNGEVAEQTGMDVVAIEDRQ